MYVKIKMMKKCWVNLSLSEIDYTVNKVNEGTNWIVPSESPIGLSISERRDWFYQI